MVSSFKILMIAVVFVFLVMFAYLIGRYTGKQDYDNLITREKLMLVDGEFFLKTKPYTSYRITKDVEYEIQKLVISGQYQWISANGLPVLIKKFTIQPPIKQRQQFKMM